MNDTGPRYTSKERTVRVLMGLIILVIGLYSALGLGGVHIFTADEDVKGVSMFLIFIGLVFGQVGACYVRLFSGHLGQALFCICFLVSAVIILIGLRNIFNVPPVGIYLMLIGFCSSVLAAIAMR